MVHVYTEFGIIHKRRLFWTTCFQSRLQTEKLFLFRLGHFIEVFQSLMSYSNSVLSYNILNFWQVVNIFFHNRYFKPPFGRYLRPDDVRGAPLSWKPRIKKRIFPLDRKTRRALMYLNLSKLARGARKFYITTGVIRISILWTTKTLWKLLIWTCRHFRLVCPNL